MRHMFQSRPLPAFFKRGGKLKLIMANPASLPVKDFSLVKNAFKELNEETSLDVVSMQPLGSVYPDTGLYAGEVGVYLALCSSKKKPELLDKGEAIRGYVFLSGGELEAEIAQGKIQDAFTIVAFALYQAKKASE